VRFYWSRARVLPDSTAGRAAYRGSEEVFAMKQMVSAARSRRRLTPTGAWILSVVAVALLLSGLVMIFAGPSTGLAFALIALGAGIVAIVATDSHRAN
jgi:hypothetical protein